MEFDSMCLTYYKDEECKLKKGSFRFNNQSYVEAIDASEDGGPIEVKGRRYGYKFKLFQCLSENTSGKGFQNLLMVAESEEDRNGWMKDLTFAIQGNWRELKALEMAEAQRLENLKLGTAQLTIETKDASTAPTQVVSHTNHCMQLMLLHLAAPECFSALKVA